MATKSPFLIYQDFISPLMCEEIISKIEVKQKIVDQDGYPEKMERFHAECEKPIFERFKPLIPEIESHYGFKYRGTESLLFQYFPVSNDVAEKPGCANSQFLRKKWIKTKDRDITGMLWLKDYNDEVPVDPRYEVYGGKLEFPWYGFSFQPQRGTLVLFPAYPHFITAISQILVGDLYCVRFNLSAENWLYQPANFPGTWQEWLANVA
jgi:hypothetical protein